MYVTKATGRLQVTVPVTQSGSEVDDSLPTSPFGGSYLQSALHGERRQNLGLLDLKGGFQRICRAGMNVSIHCRVPRFGAGSNDRFRG
jgi:hypothetical protein